MAIFLSLPCYGEDGDLLRFNNGDQLHGSFSGIAEGSSVLWKRGDIGGGVNFNTSEIRQIVLRGGRPVKSLRGLSHIGTVNGDRIPGTVRDLDGKRILLETEFAGMLEIPRDHVGLLAPSPLGGRVLYNGPLRPMSGKMKISRILHQKLRMRVTKNINFHSGNFPDQPGIGRTRLWEPLW